jgi:hypothetical protein
MYTHRDLIKLSQAAAHPRRGTNYTRNGISCKECAYATQQEQKKQRRKVLYFAIFTARNDASMLSVSHCLVKQGTRREGTRITPKL